MRKDLRHFALSQFGQNEYFIGIAKKNRTILLLSKKKCVW